MQIDAYVCIDYTTSYIIELIMKLHHVRIDIASGPVKMACTRSQTSVLMAFLAN